MDLCQIIHVPQVSILKESGGDWVVMIKFSESKKKTKYKHLFCIPQNNLSKSVKLYYKVTYHKKKVWFDTHRKGEI